MIDGMQRRTASDRVDPRAFSPGPKRPRHNSTKREAKRDVWFGSKALARLNRLSHFICGRPALLPFKSALQPENGHGHIEL